MSTLIRDRSYLPIVKSALLSIGYDQKAIITDYDFATKNGNSSCENVDLVAFSDPDRHDLQTSCIAAHSAINDADLFEMLKKLSFLAVPLVLMARHDGIELWSVRSPSRSNEDHSQLRRLQYDQIASFLVEHRQDFNPDTIKTAKLKGLQLSFMDMDPTLVEFAYNATKKLLVSSFESAVRDTKIFMVSSDKRVEDIVLTKVALQVLAAAILEDKKLFGGPRSQSAVDLLQKASTMFSQYFNTSVINQIGPQSLELLHTMLRRNITFRSFTNEMLGYFYEYTFVDPKVRKDLGIYYTPASIARQMLARLPLEDIHPTERVIFDGSCGSGNLLVAAYERLANLLPKMWKKEDAHSYLVEHIHGLDLDPFATQVAKLSLFLIGLPSGDSWDITQGDFTANNIRTFAPTIIIGNPPFKEYRSSAGRRFQTASLFLDRYLDMLPINGLIGIVLPETFLENSSCVKSRRRLLDECDILEMWHLPEGAFPVSTAATVIVLARKISPNRIISDQSPVRICRVSSHHKEQFEKRGIASYSYIFPSKSEWLRDKEAKISSSVLTDTIWGKIQTEKNLRDVAAVRNGIIPGPISQMKDFSNECHGDEWKPWLAGASCIEPYAIKLAAIKEKKYVCYPGSLLWPRFDLSPVFEASNAKILMNSGRAPGNPWRVYAAVDDYGYFPSQSFHCVIPNGDVTLQELVGFLNSPIASAWVDSNNRRRWIDERVVRSMPFPSFSKRQRNEIKHLVDQISGLKKEMLKTNVFTAIPQIRSLILLIDDMIFDAFGLSIDARKIIYNFFEGYQRPGIEWVGLIERPRAPETDTSIPRSWTVTGQVIAVKADETKVVLWVRGYNSDEPFEMTIPFSMPGWVLREGSTFHASLPLHLRDNVIFDGNSLYDFRPIDFMFLSPNELIHMFEDGTRLNGLYKSKNNNGH